MNKSRIINLFHDPGYIYISNIEPEIDEPITIRLRTLLNNVTKAFVEISENGKDWISFEMKQESVDKTGRFEFFVCTIPGQKEMFKYRFLCMNDNPDNTVYYARTYIGAEAPNFTEEALQWDHCWTMNPRLHTPDWAKGVIWYSIMPDCFYNGDTTNDETISGLNFTNAWNRKHHDLQDKYGGDLHGIIKKLDYVQELGAEAIFMNPVFRTTQNAGYGPEFYKQVEHSMGNKESLVKLSKAIHDRDMKFIMDVVFSFVHPHSIWYNDDNYYPFSGAQQEWNSKYHDWFWFTGADGDTQTYKSLWAGVEINHCNTDFCQHIYSGEDAYLPRLLKEPFCFDGFRFDTGGDLYGYDKEGNYVGDPHVVGKMRPYIKACNPNAMIMSEYSLYPSIDAGTWDARWNLEFVKQIQKYIAGEVPESCIHHWLDFEVFNIPRTAALCQYFALSDHDRPRNHKKEYYAIRPAQIILMTMVGAPCVYYGDEFNIYKDGIGTSFYAMDWKESNWDYFTLHFYKTLIDMRKENRCLRTGIVKFLSVDDENHVLAYARMDETGTAVAIASRNPYTIRFNVDVCDLGDVDGTIYTDWLTGKQYVSKDGYIDVEVIAGGTVLVKGEKSAIHKGGYNFTTIGQGKANAVLRGVECFEVCGEGDIENCVFANTEVFNTCEVSAQLVIHAGEALLLVRNSLRAEDTFVAAGVDNGKLYVAFRSVKGATVQKHTIGTIRKNSYVKIVRKADNQFKIYSTMVPGAAWKEEASVYAEMNNHAKAGFAVLKGTAILDCVRVTYDHTSVKCDDFKHGKSAMFDYEDSMKLTYLEKGLTIEPDTHTELLTYSQADDWTFKTELEYTAVDDDYAGIICKQDENNYVVAGRKMEDGKPIFFLGRANAGILLTYYSVPDSNPEAKVTIQLQRIGTTYSAIFSYDEYKWNLIGRGLIASYSVERVGLVVDGHHNATFNYASFGDAIHDGNSTNVPRTPEKIHFDYSYMPEVHIQPAYRIISGDWAYANEGYIQTSTGLGQMGISNKTHGDFKVDGTYVIDEGEGFVGFEFGKKSHDSAMGDGVLLRYTHQGEVCVSRGGRILGRVNVGGGYGVEQRLTVEMKDGYLTVFKGEEGQPILHITLGVIRGYIAYYTQGVVAHINSGYVGTNDTCLYRFNPYEYFENGFRNKWEHTLSFVNPFAIAMTDYIVTCSVLIEKIPTYVEKPYVGIYFSGVEGKFDKGYALNIAIDKNRKLMFRDGEMVLGAMQLDSDTKTADIMVCKKNRDYQIYINNSEEPVFEYTDEVLRGGVISFVSDKLVAAFKNVFLEEIGLHDTIEEAKQYIKCQ